MICPKCAMKWNVLGCELCHVCPRCIQFKKVPLFVGEDIKSDNCFYHHECTFRPKVMSEWETQSKGAEGKR